MKLTGTIADQGLKVFSEKPPLKAGRPVPRIWVVVADKGIARIFRKLNGRMDLIGEAVPDKAILSGLTNRKLGRMSAAAGSVVRHKFEPHMEQGRQDESAFAHDIADWLGHAAQAGAFDRLVLAVAPRMLGHLRAVMTDQVQSRIAAEINKDLTRLGEAALRKALNEILWF